MSRGKNNSNLVATNNSSSNGSTSSPSTQSNSGVRRGNKTLAWYISDKILDKNESEGRDSASPLSASIRPSQSSNRKNSVDSQSSLNSLKNINNNDEQPCPASNGQQLAEEEKRRKRDRRQASRPRSARRNGGEFYSTNSKENYDEKEEEDHREVGQHQEVKTSNASANVSNNNGFVNKERKEDYWYFDPVSDGFYYEFNGSRGWRKRNPKLHGAGGAKGLQAAATNTAPLKAIAEVPEQQKSLASSVPSAQQQQTSKFFPSAAAVNVPNIKYYDAASDGFFYEMASVDGWKKRQPVGSNQSGVSPPGSLQSSSQSQQQQGQFQQRVFRPLQQQQQQQSIGRPSPYLTSAISSSTSPAPIGALLLQHQQQQQRRLFGGGQRHNLTNAELEDMIIHSKSVPLSGRAGMSINQPHQQMMTNPLNFASAVSSGGQRNKTNEIVECTCNHSSSSTTISSSLSDNDHCSPPPVVSHQPQQQRHQQNQFAQQQGASVLQPRGVSTWQQSKAPQPIRQVQNGHTQTRQQPIGSFEEPYEFYWSDNDKNSMTSNTLDKASSVSSTDEIAPNRQLHPALAAYFTDTMSIQQQYNEQMEQRFKQFSKPSENGQRSNIQPKRPNSLRLVCTQSSATAKNNQIAGNNQQGGETGNNQQQSYMPHCFNVDQFIADLPPVVDHEKILHTLSAMRTPMVETSPRLASFDPMHSHQDSPLFTPVLLKEENNYYTTWNDRVLPLTKLVLPNTCNGGSTQNGSANGNGLAKNMERDLNEIEKIWKCPAF